MGTLRTRQKQRHRARCWFPFYLYGYLLLSKQVHAGPTVLSSAPISPQHRSRPDGEGMQEHTHLTRLCCRLSLPLALLTQKAGATAANAGSIHHAQASIGFAASFMCRKLLPSRTAQGAIRLESEVTTGEAISLPGKGDFGGSIALYGGS